MFENLLSIESLLAISVGAIFSFKVGKLNLSLRNDIRNKSPNVQGDNNQIIYNEAMKPVRKDIAFSVKVCAFFMIILFHMYPTFFINLLFSLAFILPVLSLVGFINTVSLNGFNRGWDILYPISSFIMGVLFYCSAMMMTGYVSLYPKLPLLYKILSSYNIFDWNGVPNQAYDIVFILYSSFACPALLILGLYLSFAHTIARDGNDAFNFSVKMLAWGYIAYLFLSCNLFAVGKSTGDNFLFLLTYPFRKLIYILSF